MKYKNITIKLLSLTLITTIAIRSYYPNPFEASVPEAKACSAENIGRGALAGWFAGKGKIDEATDFYTYNETNEKTGNSHEKKAPGQALQKTLNAQKNAVTVQERQMLQSGQAVRPNKGASLDDGIALVTTAVGTASKGVECLNHLAWEQDRSGQVASNFLTGVASVLSQTLGGT